MGKKSLQKLRKHIRSSRFTESATDQYKTPRLIRDPSLFWCQVKLEIQPFVFQKSYLAQAQIFAHIEKLALPVTIKLKKSFTDIDIGDFAYVVWVFYQNTCNQSLLLFIVLFKALSTLKGSSVICWGIGYNEGGVLSV